MVKLEEPIAGGGPEMTPVLVFRLKPAGKDPALTLKVNGPVPVGAAVSE